MNSDFRGIRTYIEMHSSSRGTGATDRDLKELVTLWGPLPADFMSYLKYFGWATVGSYELFGLGGGVEWHQNLIEQGRALWRGDGNFRLPKGLLPICNSGGGWFYCISKIHPGHPVVCWAQEYEDLCELQPYDDVYSSWSTWFLENICNRIE